MRMKLIALAVASIAAVPAFAQSNVTIYGRADGGFVSRSGSDGGVQTNGRKNEFASGIGAGSRFGFRGTEDLGGGLKAIFQFEYNVNIDQGGISSTSNNGANLGSRNTWVGLTSDSFGTILTGRVDGGRYSVATKYDPFGSGFVGNMASLQTHATRGDNALVYVSPSFSGFKVAAAYTTSLINQESGSATVIPNTATGCQLAQLNIANASGAAAAAQTVTANNTNLGGIATVPGVSANACDIQLWLIKPEFEMGGLSVTLDYESAKNKDFSNSDIDLWVLGASYDFKFMKLHGYWESAKSKALGAAPVTGNGYGVGLNGVPLTADAWDQQSYMLGVTVPVGNFSIRASWVGLNDKTQVDNRGVQRTGDCDKYSIGASYNMSKRTSLYMDFATISNKDYATCTISFSGSTGAYDTTGTGPAGGYGTKGFDLGIAHTF